MKRFNGQKLMLNEQMQSLVAQHGFFTVLRALYFARPRRVTQEVRTCLMEAIILGTPNGQAF